MKADVIVNGPSTSDKLTEKKPVTRNDILAELQMMGVNTDSFDSMSIDALQLLLDGIHTIIQTHSTTKRGRPKSTGEFIPIFSKSDKKIISQLLASFGRVSSLSLSRQLDTPLSTIQRRRVRLEKNIIDMRYSLNLEKLGWRMATLFISVARGDADLIGRKIIEEEDMVHSVRRMVGENTIDLMVEVVFKETDEFVLLRDRVKSLEGVRGIFWGEIVSVIGINNNCYQKIVEQL